MLTTAGKRTAAIVDKRSSVHVATAHDDGSLEQTAYNAVKWQILLGDIPPGSFISTQELCDRLGLGRSPVHYAVHRLQHDGLLEILPRKGILVRAWSRKDIQDLMEVRIPLEQLIARIAAERATDEELKALRKLLSDGRQYVSVGARPKLMELDHQFHRSLALLTRNAVMVEMQESLHHRSALLWSPTIAGQRDNGKVQRQHEEIVSLLLARDGEAAAKALSNHLGSVSSK
jgi:DNA-binding GntR family transcriptional regulator